VRVALGATRRSILGMFLRQGLALAAGVIVGVPIANVAARGMTALLFGVQPTDPIIYSSAALLAITMTLAGTLRPAVHASIVDPAVTLRAE
jgi:putative ABC transport system permease protein